MSVRVGRVLDLDFDLDLETDLEPGSIGYRLLACVGVLVLTASYVSVLQDLTAVVGGTRSLLAIVVAMVIAATVLSRAIAPRTAAIFAAVVAALGFAYYFTVANVGAGSLVETSEILFWDAVELVTGTSLLRMTEAGTWTLGFAPGPVFLSWYFAFRGRYGYGAIAGGAALLFLALTGDATVVLTLVGTIGALAAVGFGELERHRGSIREVDALAVVLAAVVVGSLLVPLGAAGLFGGASYASGGPGGTLEASLTSSTEESEIHGSISLSPDERFRVYGDAESESDRYWRVSVYDRYTGDEWIRTGTEHEVDGTLEGPPGETETVRQTIVLEDDFEVMPAAPRPVEVDGVDGDLLVDDHGQVQPAGSLSEGDGYTVESAVVDATPMELRDAGTDYPDEVTDRYLQRPEGTSSAFDERTREIVDDASAETPYDKAKAIENYLQNSKEYSLNVSKPDGNVAEAFLLEMDEGYCVYYATTMVQMLRAEDIPARYVSGYRSGEQVDDDEWVVRGLNAHSWVEVYFPDRGWVTFDPTPTGEREEIHDPDRNGGGSDSSDDENGSADPEKQSDESDDESAPAPYYDSEYPYQLAAGQDARDFGDRDGGTINPYADERDDERDGDDEGLWLAGVQTVGLGFAAFVAIVVGASGTNAISRTAHGARLFAYAYQLRRRSAANADVEFAYHRLEALLEERYRRRRPTESSRQYLAALSNAHPVDPRVHGVQRLYERQKYGVRDGDEADRLAREEVDEVVATVETMIREALPVVGRLWR